MVPTDIGRALVQRAQPHVFATQCRAYVEGEIAKGCSPRLFAMPVAIEPPFLALQDRVNRRDHLQEQESVPETPPSPEDLTRLIVWISPEQKFDWERSEMFLKQLLRVRHRLGLEVSGNSKRVAISILCHQNDEIAVSSAFRGAFSQCALSGKTLFGPEGREEGLIHPIAFHDYYPPPPYSHLLTRPDEIKFSPYETLISSLDMLPESYFGFYQVLFCPVAPDHDWHRNVEVLLDFEYAMKLMTNPSAIQRHGQQAPSGDLRNMAWEVENKAHNDKPFYSMAMRIGVSGESKEKAERFLDALTVFTNLFQHGGRPLNYITQEDYALRFSARQIEEMFSLGLTYRPGFIVNSWELTGAVQVPSAGILNHRSISMETLDLLSPRNGPLAHGTSIGICKHADMEELVCIPPGIRSRHTYIVGNTGTGKSRLLEHMILSDIKRGDGAAVLDPHGDLVERLLCQIPESMEERVVYFDPGRPEMVPLWNPLTPIPGQDISRAADDLVGSFKSVVTGWGDRLENFLRDAFYSLLHLPRSTLLDVSNLLCRDSPESEQLRKQILQVVDNLTIQRFWQHDFPGYRKDELGPPKHKLSKLLVSGTVSLMLSQPESRFNFREIMDKGHVLLVNLSTLGSEVRDILGSFLLSLLHLNALSRIDTSMGNRSAYHVYCDEAHRFVTSPIDDLIAETRKYGVYLTLAHQYMSQFNKRKIDAFSTVGTSIFFGIDGKDARHFVKDLRGLVVPDTLSNLEVGQAIARIGSEVVRVKTPFMDDTLERNNRDRIVARSERLYYRPAEEIRDAIKRRYGRRPTEYAFPPLGDENGVDSSQDLTPREFPV